jgi:hypothetical protein
MERKASRALLALVVALIAPAIGHGEVLTFDDAQSGNRAIASYASGGWLVESTQFHTVTTPAAGLLALVDGGSPYAASVGGGLDFALTLSRADGRPFTLTQFDAAELFLDSTLAAAEGFATAADIRLSVRWPDGRMEISALSLDGIRDGAGGGADFETFTLAPELTGIAFVTFSGVRLTGEIDAGFAIDNLVAAVPEPASGALVLAAAVVLVGISRRFGFNRFRTNRFAAHRSARLGEGV